MNKPGNQLENVSEPGVVDDTRLAHSLWAVSIGGFFSLGYYQLAGLAVPLYVASIGVSPFWIGVILGVRSLLSTLYAIHLGKMIDIIGARRIMLTFSATGVALSLLYPVFRNVGALIVLQLICGLVSTVCWMASQAAISHLAQRKTGAMGYFSFASSFGCFIGPFLVGIAWDNGGKWAAFVLSSLWMLGLLLCTICMPPTRPKNEQTRISFGLFFPRPAVYLAALRLLRLRPVQFVMALTFLRMATIVMQESFYAVLLGSKGFSGATIGSLIGLGWLVSSPAALLSAPAIRWLGSWERVLLLGTLISAVAIAATPALDSVPALAIAACLFGLGQGLGFSLVMFGAAASFPPEDVGLSVGLRSTLNRAAGIVIPPVMGAIAQGLGLAIAFWIAGATLLTALAVIGLGLRLSRKHVGQS
jgi:MFS family permease